MAYDGGHFVKENLVDGAVKTFCLKIGWSGGKDSWRLEEGRNRYGCKERIYKRKAGRLGRSIGRDREIVLL